MRLSRAEVMRVTGTAVGLEWTALRLLLIRYPELVRVLASARVFVLEACWSTQLVGLDPFSPSPDLSALRRCLDDTLDVPGQPSGRDGSKTWLLGELRINMARALAGSMKQLGGHPVLGFCGSYEGGTNFYGADGTVIENEDWDAARRYAVRWCEGAAQSQQSTSYHPDH